MLTNKATARSGDLEEIGTRRRRWAVRDPARRRTKLRRLNAKPPRGNGRQGDHCAEKTGTATVFRSGGETERGWRVKKERERERERSEGDTEKKSVSFMNQGRRESEEEREIE
ncbi:hypothetical protein TIFTF001_023317 [Ficus carica]|uniref:Uncharacterized protein n=1 Tax=Ficus carica TaxID=3494 RepID=A0AA88AZZ5_FICCA|nr:hypothetical protein TIFTF001_023317 [Ficus carica]